MKIALNSLSQDHSHDPINTPFDDWLQLYYFALNLAHQLTPEQSVYGHQPIQKEGGGVESIAVDASKIFSGLLTHITVYDCGKTPHKIFDLRQPQIPGHATRVVAHVKHLNIECHFTDAKELDHISASGFQYDVMGGDATNDRKQSSESNSAVVECAAAAYGVVKVAKASGLSPVNFRDTTDPVERAFLIEACKHFDIDYGNETIYESIVPGVEVKEAQHFPFLLDLKGEMDNLAAHVNEDDRDYHQMLAGNVFGLFLANRSVDSKGYDRSDRPLTQAVPDSSQVSRSVDAGAIRPVLDGF